MSKVFFPNVWEHISIQSLLLEPGVKVGNGKSENEVTLLTHFTFGGRRGKNGEGVGAKLARFLQPQHLSLSLRYLYCRRSVCISIA